jgi:ATP-dependent DNA helicase RecG
LLISDSRPNVRLNIRVNLIEAYDLLMDFVAKHLSDPFYLDGIQRVSLRDKIFREIVANLLVHREYTDARPATLIIYRDRVETMNAAHPHGQGPIAPEHFTPYSKNPTLSKFFMQMEGGKRPSGFDSGADCSCLRGRFFGGGRT